MSWAGVQLPPGHHPQRQGPRSREGALRADRRGVKTINALPKDERPAEVAKWKWSKDGGAESGDEDAFKIKYASVISSGWQGKHEFHSDKQWWEDVGATSPSR